MLQRGYSLLQLLLVTIIVSILSVMSVPSFFDLIQREKGTATANKIISILNYARSSSITKHVPIVICPSDDGIECQKKWGGKLLIYKDLNYDFIFDDTEDVQLKHISLAVGWAINWRAFGNRKYIYYTAGRGEFNQNGTLEICPPQQIDNITIVIINRIGRIRVDSRPWEETKCV